MMMSVDLVDWGPLDPARSLILQPIIDTITHLAGLCREFL